MAKDQTAFGIISTGIRTIVMPDGEEAVGWEVVYGRGPKPSRKSILFALPAEDALRLSEQMARHAKSLLGPRTAH